MTEHIAYVNGIYVSLPWVVMAVAIGMLITFVIMYNGDRWWGGKK